MGKHGRYTYERIALEVERQIQLRGRGAHAAASRALGITSQQFSHRLRGVYSKLDLAEIGLLADHWQAPTGWPFIPWDEAEQRDEAFRKRRQ